MKQVYLTDKLISTISIGKTDIEFKKVSPKKLSAAKCYGLIQLIDTSV